MLDMYKGVVNSPETTITNDINNTDTLIYVLDETRVPEELPNLMTLGAGISSETIKVLSIEGNTLTVERGFQGIAKSWNAGTMIARNFTEYDYDAMVENIKSNDVKVGPLASLLTTIKTSVVNSINSLKGEVDLKASQDELDTHKAEGAKDDVHGLAFKGVMVKLSDSVSVPNAALGYLGWDVVDYDTNGFFNIANPERLTIPVGVTKVRLNSNILFASNASGRRYLAFHKASSFAGGAQMDIQGVDAGALNQGINIGSGVIDVSAGDYFRVRRYQDSGGSLDIIALHSTWFSLEVIE